MMNESSSWNRFVWHSLSLTTPPPQAISSREKQREGISILSCSLNFLCGAAFSFVSRLSSIHWAWFCPIHIRSVAHTWGWMDSSDYFASPGKQREAFKEEQLSSEDPFTKEDAVLKELVLCGRCRFLLLRWLKSHRIVPLFFPFCSQTPFFNLMVPNLKLQTIVFRYCKQLGGLISKLTQEWNLAERPPAVLLEVESLWQAELSRLNPLCEWVEGLREAFRVKKTKVLPSFPLQLFWDGRPKLWHQNVVLERGRKR